MMGDHANQYREQLYDVRNDPSLSFEERVNQMVEIGCAYLGVENGHVKRTDVDAGVHEVKVSAGERTGSIRPGDVHDHARTFCRITLDRTTPLALSHASDQGWSDDPAYHEHGLECYLGAKIPVDDGAYGTVCFVDRDPRPHAFEPAEQTFVELVAHVIGAEIQAHRHEHALWDRERVSRILYRVIRHNLRNEMTTIRGSAETISDTVDGQAAELSAHIVASADDLATLSRKARRLEAIVSEDARPTTVDLPARCRAAAAAVQNDVPAASIDVTAPDSAAVQAVEYVEDAIAELLENAVTHGGDDPTVELVVDTDQSAGQVQVAVSDDGPGLPRQEQRILMGDAETKLSHGSGIGLWLVYWAVERSNGFITTAVDDGTTITVHLQPSDGGTESLGTHSTDPFV